MQKNRTTILFIISIIATLLSVGVFVFFFKVIKNKNEHTAVVMTTLEDKVLEKKNASELVKKMTQVDTIKSTLNGYFVDSASIDSFVNYLESLGVNSNTIVSVKSVEVSKTESNILLVQLSTEGNFSNVMQTVKLLENMPYKVSIQQIFFNKNTKVVTDAAQPKEKPKEISDWEANVSFSVLLLS